MTTGSKMQRQSTQQNQDDQMKNNSPMPTRQRRAALIVLLALFLAMCGQAYATAASDSDPDVVVELANPVLSSAEEINSRVTTSGVTCVNNYVTLGGYVVHQDDELGPATSMRLTHYYRTCDSPSTPKVRSFRATRFSYAGKAGEALHCSSDFQRIQVNIGAIAGYNPPLWDVACKPGGDTVLYDPADIRITAASDRSAGAEVKIIKALWPDTVVHFPVVTVPAP